MKQISHYNLESYFNSESSRYDVLETKIDKLKETIAATKRMKLQLEQEIEKVRNYADTPANQENIKYNQMRLDVVKSTLETAQTDLTGTTQELRRKNWEFKGEELNNVRSLAQKIGSLKAVLMYKMSTEPEKFKQYRASVLDRIEESEYSFGRLRQDRLRQTRIEQSTICRLKYR